MSDAPAAKNPVAATVAPTVVTPPTPEPAPQAEKLAAAASKQASVPTGTDAQRAAAQALSDGYSAGVRKSVDTNVSAPVPANLAAAQATKIDPGIATRSAEQKARFDKEVAFRHEQRQLKLREAELDAKSKALDEQLAQIDSARTMAKRSPMSALTTLGLSYDDVVSAKLASDGHVDPAAEARSAARAELDAFRKEQAEERAQQEWVRFSSQVVDDVTRQSERFELVNQYGLANQIPLLIAKRFRETGEQPSIEDVAGELETQLEVQLEKVLATAKAKARLSALTPTPEAAPAVDAVPEAVAPPNPPEQQPQPKTAAAVPNSVSTSLTPAPGSVAPVVKLTLEERKARAIARLEAIERGEA